MYFLRKKEIPLTAFFTPAYVDIHSHLLPGIDDGAKNMEDAIALLLKMRSYGMHHFITTPHVMGSIYPNSSAVILQKLAEVQAALQEKGIADIYITAAAEYLLDEVFSARLAAGDILVLKDRYILVEMSYFNAPIHLYEQLFQIQLKGYQPILAHPERCAFYHQDFEQYYALKKAGFGSGSKNYQVFFLHCSTYISVQINSCFDRKKRIAVTEASLKAASCIPKIYLPFRSASNT